MSQPGAVKVALYARVSTAGGQQTVENQLLPLRAFATARGWTAIEFTDTMSGAKEQRPALTEMLKAVKSRKVDVVVCVKLDRLARSVRHLVNMTSEFEALGVDLVVLDQAIDTTLPTGRLLFHVLAAISEFERSLIVSRIHAGLALARSRGKKLGPAFADIDMPRAQALLSGGMSIRAAARTIGCSAETLRRRTRAMAGNGAASGRAQGVPA